jgi:hypothetical protein
MSHSVLPAQFSELEPFATEWALATTTERHRKRLGSSMAEIKAFYDRMLPRMDAILTYLNQFPLNGMPASGRRLFFLALSLAEVAPAVECYGQPGVIDGFEAERFVPGEERS